MNLFKHKPHKAVSYFLSREVVSSQQSSDEADIDLEDGNFCILREQKDKKDQNHAEWLNNDRKF